MYSTGNTSTLADMWVECSCGAKRSMSGATQRDNFDDVACPGHHPFRPNVKNHKCNKPIIPSQRGASNVYFAVSRSAISIPPWINPLYNLIDEHLRLIESYKEDFGEMGVQKVYEKYFSAFTREEFDEALEHRLKNIKEFTEIKQMEYNAIIHHNDPTYASNKKHFKAEEDALPGYLQKYFGRIIRVTRLREVRVLLGFTRVDAPDPDADEQPNVVALSKGKQERWLPAAEVNGEGKSQRGVFVKFFVNDIDKQPGFDKILRYKGRFLKIYNYHQEDDKMAALHAKVISVDQQQTLITSANLSYHGQQGNIELGTLIESKQIAKQIDDVFTKLIFSKVFSEV